jgi:hypothetical protein
MVLRRFLKTIQSEENLFHVVFPDGRKIENGRKTHEFPPRGLPQAPLALGHPPFVHEAVLLLRVEIICNLFFKLDRCKKNPVFFF